MAHYRESAISLIDRKLKSKSFYQLVLIDQYTLSQKAVELAEVIRVRASEYP